MKNYLEIFIVAIETDEAVRYTRTVLDISETDRNPDDLVLELVKTPSFGLPAVSSRFISHSTSWRYDNAGAVYLTYLVFSEHADFSRVRSDTLHFDDMRIITSPSAEKPRPEEIREEHVLSHGLRHLSHLVHHSPYDIYKSVLSNKSQAFFAKLGPLPAGKI